MEVDQKRSDQAIFDTLLSEATHEPSETDLKTTLKVIAYLAKVGKYKQNAISNTTLRLVMKHGREIFYRSKEDKNKKKKETRKHLKKLDHLILDQTDIRLKRNFVDLNERASLPGGSQLKADVLLPPRIPNGLDNEVFQEQDDNKISKLTAEALTSSNIQSSIDQEEDKESTESHEKHKQKKKFNFKRSCHICGTQYWYLDEFYDQLCESCSKFNMEKRNASCDLKGKVCLVTGARVKIGFMVALKLLRMGGIVAITTRFPHDAGIRYSKEPDFESFKGRLKIYGLDFRDISMVHYFCAHFKSQFEKLDILINNAAQTVRRPPQYYQHLIPIEEKPIEKSISDIIDVLDVFKKITDSSTSYVFEKNKAEIEKESSSTTILESKSLTVIPGTSKASHSAQMSQISFKTDPQTNSTNFPPGLYDRDFQQIDLRKENSWTLGLGEVSTLEMIECHSINAFAPWVIISELTKMMPLEGHKFVVNVSAMEGQFYRRKTHLHPHTNMAKASLNMLTRTSAAKLASENIYMTCVDTGWITDEQPLDQWEKRVLNPPPLDEVDAAMRILDPVLRGVCEEELLWGVFLKNYFPTRW